MNPKLFLKKHYPELLVVLVTLLIFTLNLTPGAYLAGWDSLQTELDPTLGIKRALFSVWQEYQSFGLTAGMAHAADLPRAVLIFLISPILPNWIVRYSFHILMLGIAGLGMLKLLRFSLNKHLLFITAGALFYMLCFSTIQMMFLPFEPFSVFFASLPWLIWMYLKTLTHEHRLHARDWLLFMLINILAVPSFVAQQLFVIYALTLFLLACGLLISKTKRTSMNHESRITNQEKINSHYSYFMLPDSPNINSKAIVFKRALISAILLLSINAFWLLPQVYFLVTNGSVVQESKINQIATEDIFYSNQDRGNLNDFLTHTGFFSDRLNAQDQFLFEAWNTHRQNPFVLGALAGLITITLLGIVQKSPYRRPFLLLYALCALSLLSNTEPVSTFNEIVRQNNFINQMFRSPFTKFSILHALVAAYFFTYGLVFLLGLFHRNLRKVEAGIAVVALALVLIPAVPAFQGEYFSREMKVKIPQEYQGLLQFFQTMPKDKRVALLPDYTFWGWFQTTWGYNGSGFLWYGIEQPFVSRTFDVWSFPSESYYWELKAAVEAEDKERFASVLKKYDISYLIFDRSLTPIVADQKSLQYEVLGKMLDQSSDIKVAKTLGDLTVYEVLNTDAGKDFVSLASDVPNIGPAVRMTNDDTAFMKYGTYQTDANRPYQAYFPFLDLMTQTQNKAKKWDLSTRASSYIFSSRLPFSSESYSASISSQSTFDIYNEGSAVKYTLPLETEIGNNQVSVSFPAFRIDAFSMDKAKVDYCLRQIGNLEALVTEKSISLKTSDNATGCIEFEDPSLNQRYGYLVEVKNSNQEGPRFYFYTLDGTKKQAYVEDRIATDNQFYVLGPHFSQGLGYSFSLQNGSYRNSAAANTLEGLSVYLLPYDEIKKFELVNTNNPPTKAVISKDFDVQKKNYYLHELGLPATNQNQTLILSQAYQPGWKAYSINNQCQISNVKCQIARIFPYFYGEEIKSHVVINNWANGWNLANYPLDANNYTLILVYLPQYLEYFGLIVLAIGLGTLIILSLRKKETKPQQAS